jgi:uridylate kinase
MEEVEANLKKNNVVFCGALRYTAKSTSDSTAAKLANKLKTDFINITNIPGLYTANPLTHKSAKFIPKISWKAFDSIANRRKYRSGQHFVLDQKAATLVHKHKIRTFIIGPDMRNLDKILSGKCFKGTLIEG